MKSKEIRFMRYVLLQWSPLKCWICLRPVRTEDLIHSLELYLTKNRIAIKTFCSSKHRELFAQEELRKNPKIKPACLIGPEDIGLT